VEVSIALMVSTVVVVGILSLYTQSILVTKKMNQRFIATKISNSRLELLRLIEFASLPTSVETDTLLDKDGNSDLDGTFIRTTSVVENYNSNADLTLVTVTVDYKVKGKFSQKPILLTTVYVNE